MLISHSHQFIYMKTQKTAGTSVEILLEGCCDDRYSGPAHFLEERITPIGIIGARGDFAVGARFYNHAAASHIRALIGDRIWNRYTKIACVRNPFDKAVSAFWFCNPDLPRDMASEERRDRFRDFVCADRLPIDWHVYTIDDTICADYLLRYESLADDIDRMAAALRIETSASRLGRYKGEYRPRSISIADHYDPVSIERVRTAYARDFAHLGYDSQLPLDVHSAPGAADNPMG